MIISKLTKEELLEAAHLLKISILYASEEEFSKMCEEFDRNFSHPSVSNLFFWPENHSFVGDQDKIASYDPTPERIVEIGIAHKSICL